MVQFSFRLNTALGIAAAGSLSVAPLRDCSTGIQQDRDVTFSVIPAKTSFALGKPVEFVLRAENQGGESVTYQFGSSCQAFFHVELDGRLVFSSRLGTMCAQVLTGLEFSPGEQHDFTFRWNQVDIGGAPVSAGEYQIVAYLADDNSPQVSTSIRVD